MIQRTNRWQFRLRDVMVFTALFAVGCSLVPRQADPFGVILFLGVHLAALGIVFAARRAWVVLRSVLPDDVDYARGLFLAFFGAVPALMCWLFFMAGAFLEKARISANENIGEGLSVFVILSLPFGWLASFASLFVIPRRRNTGSLWIMTLLSLAISTTVLWIAYVVMNSLSQSRH